MIAPTQALSTSAPKLKFLISSLLLCMHLGGATSSTVVQSKTSSALDQLTAVDRRDIRELIENDESLQHLDLLEAKYDVETHESLGLPAVELTFASRECEGRVRQRTVATRNVAGWHASGLDRMLGEVILRGTISCAEADRALAAFAAHPGSIPAPIPYAVGKAYSFIAATELGGKVEDLLAVTHWEGSIERIVLIRGSSIVGIRSRAAI
jgi:hypothetical protein